MTREHLENLRFLRDYLVEDRRNLVAALLSDPRSAGESATDMMKLQQFIEVVERAIAHEASLERPAGAWPPPAKPRG